MRQIQLRAHFVVSKFEHYQRIAPREQVEIIRQSLARELAEAITRRDGFFTTHPWEHQEGGTVHEAECYVLSVEDFHDLCAKIRSETLSMMPTRLGSIVDTEVPPR
jgi:hypothetical protein